jgi:SAM-dependent methyltransferase
VRVILNTHEEGRARDLYDRLVTDMLHTPADVEAFYARTFHEHGPNARGMSWTDSRSHSVRLRRLHDLIQAVRGKSYDYSKILDVGCGIGMVPLHWGLSLHESVFYYGVDLVREYITEAQMTVRSGNSSIIRFEHADLMNWRDTRGYDVTLAIGTFAWQPYDTVMKIIKRMWEYTSPGGVMAMTYLPDRPLSSATVKWLNIHLVASEHLLYGGYINHNPECIAIYKKKNING